MAYDSIWERLNDITRRVVDATGCSKEEAQADICRAVADGVIQFQARLKQHATRHMTSKAELEGTAFDRLTTIKPDNLDWEQSRPLKPWLVKSGAHRLPGFWKLDWVELSRTDIERIFGDPPTRGDSKLPSSGGRQRVSKSGPSLERAKRVIGELYPRLPPDQATLPNKHFCSHVRAKLKELKLPDVSDDTILRAAGRRRR